MKARSWLKQTVELYLTVMKLARIGFCPHVLLNGFVVVVVVVVVSAMIAIKGVVAADITVIVVVVTAVAAACILQYAGNDM